MPKKRYARIDTSLVVVGPARTHTTELDQPTLFEEVIPRVAPVGKVPDVDDERSREHFTQGA